MRPSHDPAPNPLTSARGEKPDLKELTISLGRQDLYVNLDRHINLDDGHILYEAILTDEKGSRVIYVDRDDIAECIRESFFLEPSTNERPGGA